MQTDQTELSEGKHDNMEKPNQPKMREDNPLTNLNLESQPDLARVNVHLTHAHCVTLGHLHIPRSNSQSNHPMPSRKFPASPSLVTKCCGNEQVDKYGDSEIALVALVGISSLKLIYSQR